MTPQERYHNPDAPLSYEQPLNRALLLRALMLTASALIVGTFAFYVIAYLLGF